MENLFIEEDNYSPRISLNYATGTCEIRGDSHMEQPRLFYKSVIYWFNKFTSSKKRNLQVDFLLKYYNTGSARVLFEIFSLLEKSPSPVAVNWYAENRDTDMVDEGHSFKEDFPKINFNVIVKNRIAF